MKRQRALDLLSRSRPELQDRFGVIRPAFDGPATSRRYFGVRFYLEDLLGYPVDLFTEKALRPELCHCINEVRL